MGVKMEGAASTRSRPSLFLTCRLASIVQKVKCRLQEKVSQRKRIINPFGASYQRGTRLRALSDLEKVALPRRRQSITSDPKSDLNHEAHATYINGLLHDLDNHTHPKSLSLTKVAAHDKLLLSHSRKTLVETLTEHINLQHVAYLFDLSTFLILRLEAISSDEGPASQNWMVYNVECDRLKDEKYIANLLHLLRRLQHFLFKILVHRSLKRLDELHDHWQKHDSRQEGKALDDDWFSEWPSGQRPLSTTWPWNIRPSLVVLWGVCWMFYPSAPGDNDNTARVPAQNILDSLGFMESWSQNMSQTDLDEARNIRLNETVLAYSEADHNATLAAQAHAQAPTFLDQGANSSRRSSVSAAPHLELSTSTSFDARAFTPPNPAGIHSPQRHALVASSPRHHVAPTTYYNTIHSPAFASDPVSRDSNWAVASGGNFSTYTYAGNDTSNVFAPAYNQPPIRQAPFYYDYQTTPALEVSPVTGGPSYPPHIDSPTPNPHYNQLRRNSSNSYLPVNMGNADNATYPMSPPSERHRSASIATSASPVASIIPSPIMSTSQSPQTSETSARQQLAVPRAQELPRNEQGEIYCNHEDCSGNPPVFRRRCEWNKHMDKHERPYKCKEPGCDKIQGFTYSGGLLRHQREVHKKNATTREPLFCKFANCNRSSGTGFTRRENLNEHMRRRHNVGSATQSSPLTTTAPILPVASETPTESSRKRKRIAEAKAPPEQEKVDFDDSGIADTEDPQEQIKRLKREAEEKDRRFEEMRTRYEDQVRTNEQLQMALSNLNQMMGNRTQPSQVR